MFVKYIVKLFDRNITVNVIKTTTNVLEISNIRVFIKITLLVIYDLQQQEKINT